MSYPFDIYEGPTTQRLNHRDMPVISAAYITADRWVVVVPAPHKAGEYRISVTNSAGTLEGNGSYVSVLDGTSLQQEMARLHQAHGGWQHGPIRVQSPNAYLAD